ncbi:hypothetical protein E2542_SST27002 [Spatholobus suberectus]|nr:hypothetical protein E2542_SST27002 [Spatholobus suberectus]
MHYCFSIYFTSLANSLSICYLSSFFVMASQASTFFAFVLVALFCAAANAQDFGLSPAPSPDAGAAGSVSSSVAVIGASVVLSLMAILKH